MIESLDRSYDEAVRLFFISNTFNRTAGYYLSQVAKDLVQTCVDVLKETKDPEIEVQYLTKTNNIEKLTIEVLFTVFKVGRKEDIRKVVIKVDLPTWAREFNYNPDSWYKKTIETIWNGYKDYKEGNYNTGC